MTDDSLRSFTEALKEFQASMPHVGKDNTATVPTKTGGKYTYTYTDLTTLHNIALPLLTKLGFAWICKPTMQDGQFVLAYSLLHVDGWCEDGAYPLPQSGTPQEIGSAITYSRRYAFCAVTGIAPGGEDDDGAKASQAPVQPRQQAPKPSGKPPMLAAKERVWASAEKLGWSKEDVSVNYAKDHEGVTVETATAADLNKWAEDLEKDLAAQFAPLSPDESPEPFGGGPPEWTLS